jgi:hypothetical protein
MLFAWKMTPVGSEPTQLALGAGGTWVHPLRQLGQSVLTNMQVVCQILIQIKLPPKQYLICAVPASKVKPIKHVINNVKMAMWLMEDCGVGEEIKSSEIRWSSPLPKPPAIKAFDMRLLRLKQPSMIPPHLRCWHMVTHAQKHADCRLSVGIVFVFDITRQQQNGPTRAWTADLTVITRTL